VKVRRQYETKISASMEALWAFHGSAEVLRKLSPPGQTVRPVGEEIELRDGALHVLEIRSGPIRFQWRARISDVQAPGPGIDEAGFTDTAEKSPFPSWRHRHAFLRTSEGCLLRDTIDYTPPGGLFAPLVNLVASRMIDLMFRHRHRVTKAELEAAR
jgi:ligand-binding SRPBCC domain-containing protein